MAIFSIYLFPVWVLIFSAYALIFPEPLVELKSSIVPLLMAVMLGMGMTLRWQDFAEVLQRKSAVALGVGIQFVVMPLAALGLAQVLNLSQDLTIGLMLVGATAGGTASNVMTYLVKGNVALSVSMTLVSTLCAIVLLPFLTWFYLNETVSVPAWGMLMSLVQLILLPISVGLLLNHFFAKPLQLIQPILPVFSMFAIIFIIAIVVALNHLQLQSIVWMLALAVITHNAIGLISGYGISKLVGFDEKTARTVAIEVGMQNSGLSVALALKYFSAMSALPGALFSVWHNISGSLLAAYWQRKDLQKREP
ncbi:bile acid:sodium symporter family protein [Hydrogenovibrio sp. 3SP14C1]|uniref:bile acid:sodium symporter family protein n=1 Tax=Hydrogenovibrio sp. 3SP14C1 TaxID=3038774 RepID=UPI00241664FD|nr:bile acid:sodium symporter family protein [Hydrogenovibrio sp. 3SP14C1]MDG4812778.1 bile acid:sodium symporter family protein [Hydrogenovibrio sp. 3SP14C1]